MLQRNSLRFRVAIIFAAFGALLSILFCSGIYLVVHQIGNRLIDETLQSELDDSVMRHTRDQIFVPPNTVSIKGYVLSDIETESTIPPEIRTLSPGQHDVEIDRVDYRVLVADRSGARYFLLFDTDSQREREDTLLDILSFFAVFMVLGSAGGGTWLAIRIITPVTRLAEQIGHIEPSNANLPLDKLARHDEVGELARAFDRYLSRLREFIKREKYFAADISHELRTPIAIVKGAVEVIELDDTFSVKQRERVERIKYAAQDMKDLTDALLMLAREHNPVADEPMCNVEEVVRDTFDKHRHLIDGLPVSVRLELGEPLHMVAERPLLEIVIGNLLRNAFGNTRSGEILLRLEAQRFIIKDPGLGMSEEVLAHVFDRHFKGETSSGEGVGLSLVKRICDRYGWRISIASQPEQGTTVEISFAAEDTAAR